MKYFIQKQANIKPHDIFLFISTRAASAYYITAQTSTFCTLCCCGYLTKPAVVVTIGLK